MLRLCLPYTLSTVMFNATLIFSKEILRLNTQIPVKHEDEYQCFAGFFAYIRLFIVSIILYSWFCVHHNNGTNEVNTILKWLCIENYFAPTEEENHADIIFLLLVFPMQRSVNCFVICFFSCSFSGHQESRMHCTQIICQLN